MNSLYVKTTALLFGLLLVLGVGLAIPGHAEPYMALRTGLKCSVCHFNRSGGGMRTSFGVIYSQTNLAIKPVRSGSFYDGKLTRSVSVGANFRVENVSVFPYKTPGGREGDAVTSTRIPEANLYLSFNLIPEFLTLYADQTIAPTTSNREFFGLISGLPYNSYAKVGRMLLPYGWRLRDDEAFVRDRSGYTYNRHDVALEIGIEPGPFSMIGTFTDTYASFVGQTVFRRFRVGGSFSSSIKGQIDYKYGVLAGASFGRFSVAGEVDWIFNKPFERLAVYSELYYYVSRGLYTRVSYEFFDRRRDVPNENDGQDRITLGIESFITQFTQVSLFYRINRFIPQNTTMNQNQLLVQLHVFF